MTELPRRLHLFWTGTNAPTSYVAEWRTLMVDWDVHVWTIEPELGPIAALAYETAGNVDRLDHVRHAANLVRWWLLYTYGGVWVDIDVAPLRRLDPLIGSSFVAIDGAGIAMPSVVGGEAGHPLWLTMIDGARSRTGTSPNVSGCHPLTEALADYPEIRREPPGRFAAFDSSSRAIPLPSDGVRYTTHTWATSTRRRRRFPTNTHSS